MTCRRMRCRRSSALPSPAPVGVLTLLILTVVTAARSTAAWASFVPTAASSFARTTAPIDSRSSRSYSRRTFGWDDKSDLSMSTNPDDDAEPSRPIDDMTSPPTQPTPPTTTRRGAITTSLLSTVAASTLSTATAPYTANAAGEISLPNFLLPDDRRSDNGIYKQARRATAYLVDSTIPPTLVPYRAGREAAILKELGQGSGTSKSPFYQESINLNNMLQKGVFGTAKFVSNVIGGGSAKDRRSGPGYASFAFLGVDYADADDAELAVGLLTDICRPRRDVPTAVGLALVPYSAQSVLDTYLSDGDETALIDALVGSTAAGAGFVDRTTLVNYMPLFKFARSKNLSLLALSPEPADIVAARTEGIQNVNMERRSMYVVDSDGFIALTQDPRYKLYAEKSLLRDFKPTNDKDSPGDYFAERILVHEAVATGVARWAVKRPDAFVAVVAPIADVRYMGGPNGRVPRVYNYLWTNSEDGKQGSESKVDENAVTTILLNPSAEETLSKSKFLRLEIGTAPSTLEYQTKVADYLWFSRMPKVNMIPRMMNY